MKKYSPEESRDFITITNEIKKSIRSIPDFPKKGINFIDITPLLNEPYSFETTVELLSKTVNISNIDKIVAMESRGFIFGAALALKVKKGFVPVRKPGKLPSKTVKIEYELEYGKDCLEIHEDAINQGEHVLIIDDLLATGGTAKATAQLVEKLGGKVEALIFVVELEFLHGREKLNKYKVESLIKY